MEEPVPEAATGLYVKLPPQAITAEGQLAYPLVQPRPSAYLPACPPAVLHALLEML